MVLLNGRPIRLTLEQAIIVLDIFDHSIPCWLADTCDTPVAAALIDRLATQRAIGAPAWDVAWVN